MNPEVRQAITRLFEHMSSRGFIPVEVEDEEGESLLSRDWNTLLDDIAATEWSAVWFAHEGKKDHTGGYQAFIALIHGNGPLDMIHDHSCPTDPAFTSAVDSFLDAEEARAEA